MSRRVLIVTLVAVALLGAACGNSSKSPKATGDGAAAPVTVRLGYFPNVTHATAVAGVQQGIFARALGSDRLQASTFNAGPAAVEALFSGALDATYIGPNPTINAFVQSKGKAVRIISGATSGGASLVVKPAISSPADLKGKKLASPQLGGTQDVALRYWLAGQGLKTDVQGGGDVSISPQDNSQTLETFRSGAIDGAWVPEPWATRLVQEGGGKVLVDERDLWPGQRFVTTQLIVRTAFLEEHPDAVRRLLEGQLEANAFVNEHPAEAQAAVNAGIATITGKKLPDAVIKGAWATMSFSNDPVASSLAASAEHAEKVGLLAHTDLKGIYALGPLNQVLAGHGQTPIAA